MNKIVNFLNDILGSYVLIYGLIPVGTPRFDPRSFPELEGQIDEAIWRP